jgi:hypothetical protein
LGGGARRRLAVGADPRQPNAHRRKLSAPTGRHVVRAFKLDVLRIENDKIVEITTFGSGLFPVFGLRETL